MNNRKIKKLIVIGIILVIILIIGFLVFNHIRKSYNVEEVIEEKYLILSNENKIGVKDADGNTIIDPQYQDVQIPNPSKPIFVCY